MMKGPVTFSGLNGETATYEFRPEYSLDDWHTMQSLIDDATMRGVVAMRFIHDAEVRVVITTSAD